MAQSLFASGIIRGRVFDEISEQALPAANVAIQGTNFGAAADVNGQYIILNAPSGEQTLVITYIGYVSVAVEVTILEGGTVVEDFGLQPDVVQGREVNVTAQARGQIQAINQQLASDKISSVVSEARIQELPDFNAAQALSRLPGVSTLESSGEANKVVIRGLAPQYNSVAVEGVKLASTGSTQMGVVSLDWITSGKIDNDRSVDLSMVSPYMIKTISVYKSLTPDMNANSLGGTVNMELREAPSELHYDLLWQSGYTAKTGNYGNYRTVASFSQRFLNEQVGVYLLGNAERYDRDADNMSALYSIYSSEVDTTTGYRPIKVRDVTLNRHLETRNRYGGNLILDYRLPSGSLKSVNMFTRLESDYTDHRTVLGYISNVMDFTIREGVNTIDLTVNSLAFNYDLSRMAVDLKWAQTTSRNNLPESPYSRFRQTGGLGGTVTVDTPPDSLKNNVEWYGTGYTLLSNISLFSSLYTEEKQLLSADFKFPIGIGTNLVGYIKIGGQYHDQSNANDQESPYARIGTGSNIQDEIAEAIVQLFHVQYDSAYGRFPASQFMGDSSLWTEPFLNDRFGTFYWGGDADVLMDIAKFLHTTPEFIGRTGGPEDTGGWFNGLYQKLANDYQYSEQYTAGYIMSELSLPKLKIVGGARYEKVQMKYTAYNMVDARSPEAQYQFLDTITVKPMNEYLLPSVQMKYSPVPWMDIRYAYTETLARPDYHQLSPKYTMSTDFKNVWAGNPDLKPAHSFNNDLMVTFYGNKLGLLSIGAFVKTVKDFTYSTRYQLFDSTTAGLRSLDSFYPWQPYEGAWLNTYMNTPYNAYVKGIEFDFQTRFWYLPQGLDGVILGLNYTKIQSEATYPMRDNKTFYPPRPARPYTITIDSTRSGRLIHQPNDIFNAYIGYESGGFSARVSFLFQGNAVSYVGAFPEQDGYTRDYFRIDASVRQKLPFWGTEIYLDCTNLNSETNAAAQRSIDGFTSEKHYGLTANLGVRFKL